MSYFHYTSRLGAQDIICTHILEPGRSGRLYFTDVEYQQGATAADDLAITGKPVEVGMRLADTVPVRIEGPFEVEPWRDSAGLLTRAGGGREFVATEAVDPNSARWFTLGVP